jgi:hypothetical protein
MSEAHCVVALIPAVAVISVRVMVVVVVVVVVVSAVQWQ